MLTMTPPLVVMAGSTARHIANSPRQLVPITVSQSWSVLPRTVLLDLDSGIVDQQGHRPEVVRRLAHDPLRRE